MKYSCPLLISQEPYELKYDITETINMQIKKFMMFLGKGTAKLSAKLYKNAYHSDEKIVVLCDIDNSQCEEDIVSVDLEFRQHIRMKGGFETFHERKVLYKNTFAGVPKGKSSGGYNLEYEIPLKFAKNHNLEKLPTPDKIHFFTDGIQPTTFGKKLSIMYTIKVKATYSNYGAKKLKTVMPVFIQAPRLEEVKQPEIESKKLI